MTEFDQILETLSTQEAELQFDKFDNDDAYDLGNVIYDIAKAEELPVTIDIIRSGQQLFHAALKGTAPDNDEWIKRKVKLVNRVQKSSYRVSTELKASGKTLEEMCELSHFEYAAHGGCVPIVVKGVGMVGTVTVSGLEQSKDHELVIRGIGRFLSKSVDQSAWMENYYRAVEEMEEN